MMDALTLDQLVRRARSALACMETVTRADVFDAISKLEDEFPMTTMYNSVMAEREITNELATSGVLTLEQVT